jgi:hypothetical protein
MLGLNGSNLVQALNKSDCYAYTAGWPQHRRFHFPSDGIPDPRGTHCMLALYQDKDAWRNKICKSLSLFFPALQRSDSL